MTSVRRALAILFLSPGIMAQPSVFEHEPNDTPDTANPLSGAAIVLGTMNDGDQDGFMWTVSDEDAQKRWVFELHGIPGRLTIADVYRVEFADNGVDVVHTDRLTKLGTRDGSTPAITRDLVFEPGEYLIGIAYAGGSAEEPQSGDGMFRPPAQSLSFGEEGSPDLPAETAAATDPEPGAYRFVIREGSKLHVRAEAKTGASREDALGLRPGAESAVFESRASSWYALDFDAADATQRWDIRVQVPVGRALNATLFDANGAELDSKRSGERGLLEFPDIAPKEQAYLVRLEPMEPGFVTAIGSAAVGRRVAGEEAEPNGTWELANRVDLSEPLIGRISESNDQDYFRFALGETAADELLKLRIESEPDAQTLEFCLLEERKTRVQCRRGTTPLELPGLLLTSGEWGLSITRAKAEFEYRVSLDVDGPIEPGFETEPNDTIEFASAVPSKNRIRGRISGDESDYFRFLVAEEPQLWRFQVIGDGLTDVAYYDGAGKQVARRRLERGQRRLRLDELFLLPGKHYLMIRGEDGASYTVLARPLGPPDPNGEREPNDDTSRMQRLAMGQTRTGLLSDPTDDDYYRFFLANWDHVRLKVEPPADGMVAPHLHWYGESLAQGVPVEAGQTMSIAGVFPPGDYHLALSARKPSDSEYRLSLERLPRYACAADCEPNGSSEFYLTAPLPPDLVLEGVSGDWRDTDIYQLPELSAPSALVIRSPDRAGRVFLGPDPRNREALDFDAETGTYRTIVPAGGPYQITVESRGEDYRLELEFERGPQPRVVTPLAADLDLQLDGSAVSAYRTHGQRLDGRVTITHAGSSTLAGRLEATTSNYRWQVALEEREVEIPSDGKLVVPLQVLAPPDAWADRPVRLSLRMVDEHGAQAETWTEIDVDRDLPPVRPTWNWPIPDAMRGGFNAAWMALGAEWSGELPKGSRFDLLRDGLVFAGARMECCSSAYGWDESSHPALTVELPGEAPLPVAGIALNHFGSSRPYRNIRRATLMLSEDGTAFDEALIVEPLPVETEQYFALPAPVPARHARLRIEETFNATAGRGGLMLGEWKVILEPGHDLSGGRGFNLADPELGGHLVWDSPPQAYAPVAVLDEEERSQALRHKAGVDVEYVIGFHENRQAQIQRVEWTNPEDVNPEQALAKVVISVSRESPVGPWQRVGELDPGHSSEPSMVEFDAPVWARFVKLTGVPQPESRKAAAPEVIRIRERPTDDDYRSVLTEWGHGNRQAFYEMQAGIPPEPELTASGHDSRASAAPLVPGGSATGQVALAKHDHWYVLRMPEDANTLRITLSGDPTVRTVVALEDASGEPIPARRQPRESTPDRHVFEALAEPGAELYLQIFEPPRNVVFNWDTSASVNAYLPTIYNALAAFVSQVVPGRESVNLVPFGRGPLLESWMGEPYMLQTILNDYPRRESSSAGERALAVSMKALAPQAGNKSIVTITDGAVNHHAPMWKEARDVQPRVFGVAIAGTKAEHSDVFQDWASINGGHLTQLNYQGEMEVAFDRAATLMRRPADYTLEVQTEFREAPGPGTLQVVGGGDSERSASLADGAVELILDASGSMLQRMEGKRRITVAKEVLTEAVRAHIPAGTPVALRVFGHQEAGTCRTELELPLAPLDPEAVATAIGGIRAMNLAKTPIADSLAAVPSDLKGATGRLTVVLVTDGEETCDGDPAAVIDSLAEQGFEATLNIVGFAIDDPELEAQFAEWADLGGGRYYSATDQEGLSNALEEALQVAYAVYDARGELAAEGLVDGAPVELEQGYYRVVVANSPAQTFEQVEVQGESAATLRLE